MHKNGTNKHIFRADLIIQWKSQYQTGLSENKFLEFGTEKNFMTALLLAPVLGYSNLLNSVANSKLCNGHQTLNRGTFETARD